MFIFFHGFSYNDIRVYSSIFQLSNCSLVLNIFMLFYFNTAEHLWQMIIIILLYNFIDYLFVIFLFLFHVTIYYEKHLEKIMFRSINLQKYRTY